MNEMKRLVVYIGLITSSYGCHIPNNCINGTCHTFNAKSYCTIRCKDGFAGIYCREWCEYTCHACLRNDPRTCTRCEEGRFGKTCGQKCSNCLNEKCFINGTCIEGCKSSWWGLKCDSNCELGYDCDHLTSPIGQGLESSTSFNRNLCPKHCRKINPPDDRICNSATGQCLHGCEDGFTGSNCQITLPEGTEVSTVLPKPSVSCPPPCLQCSDDGACLACPGLNGQNCSTCGQDGGCLDECGAGCVNKSNTHTESFIEDVPRDTWDQIDHLIKKNALLLPLLCCGLALIVIVTVGVTLKCSGHKRTQSFNMNSASIPEKQKEETLFAKCGDIYHEIEDSQLDSHPLITPVLEEIPREQGHGHIQKLHRADEKQSKHGGQDHNHGSGIGRRLDGAAGPRKCENRCHRHNGCLALLQDNISKAEKESVTHQNAFVTNSPENRSYITPIQEIIQPDIWSTEACSKVNLEQQDVIPRRSERSSYVTAISEAEHRKLIGRGCNKDINKDKSISAEKVYMGCKEQCISMSAVVVDEGSMNQGEFLSGVAVEERCREQCKPLSAVVVEEGCREQCKPLSAVVVEEGCREQSESPSAVAVEEGCREQCKPLSAVVVEEGCREQCKPLSAVVVEEGCREQSESPSAVAVEEGCREQCKPLSAVVVEEGCGEQSESPSAVVIEEA